MAELPDQKSPTSLVTLPAELTRLIVSNLAPSPDALFRGCKQDLKNANLAHRCFHEWVPEFMFRDMALQHVLVGMSSHLELFGVTPGNEQLLKHVKHIRVQVPPALRWEIGSGNPFAHHLEEMTAERLCAKFRVKTPAEMTEEQRQYCTNYYHAMVDPFTDNRNWYRLLRAAGSSFGRVFKLFGKLEEISVGSCEIVEMPSPTITHTFVLQHGEDVEQELSPGFIEDDCVNVSWASSIIAKEAPSQIRILKLSLANMDNYNSFATVNRLLSLVYRHSPEKRTFAKEIYLSLRGIDGTHGNEAFHGDSGSVGPVRHWRSVLSNAPNLEHLHITPDFDEDPAILSFSEGELTNTKASILEWLLSGLRLPRLRKLTLHNFRLDVDKIERVLSGQWPRLETLILSHGTLELNIEEIESPLSHLTDEQIGHIHGQSWVDACQTISKASASVDLKVVTPYTSTTKTYGRHRPHPKYLERLKESANVVIDSEDYYQAPVYAPGDALVPFGTDNSDTQ